MNHSINECVNLKCPFSQPQLRTLEQPHVGSFRDEFAPSPAHRPSCFSPPWLKSELGARLNHLVSCSCQTQTESTHLWTRGSIESLLPRGSLEESTSQGQVCAASPRPQGRHVPRKDHLPLPQSPALCLAGLWVRNDDSLPSSEGLTAGKETNVPQSTALYESVGWVPCSRLTGKKSE